MQQNSQQPPVTQASQSHLIQPQTQRQIIGSPYVVSNQGCCCSMQGSLPDNIIVHSYRLGLCMLVVGMISSILGVVGFFILGHDPSDTSHPDHSYVAPCGIRAYVYIAPNIWCGLFVSSIYDCEYKVDA